jgi:hypothetical protein
MQKAAGVHVGLYLSRRIGEMRTHILGDTLHCNVGDTVGDNGAQQAHEDVDHPVLAHGQDGKPDDGVAPHTIN